MIELYLSKVTESSETEMAGKTYARVNYKQSLTISDMARHMAEHNTVFSEGSILGVLTDFVKCVREMVLNGNTVKIANLAIFKATVEANGLEVLYDPTTDKTVTASIGELKSGDKTGPAVKTIKLLAQSTGEFTRDELKKDARLSWTDKARAEIAAAKGGAQASPDPSQGGENNGGTNTGGSTGGNTGGNESGGTTGGNTGGNTGGEGGGDNGGDDNGGGDGPIGDAE